MNNKEAKELLQNNIDFLKSLSAPEYTLYRKGAHMNTPSIIKGVNENKKTIQEVKNNIGTPDNSNDYQNLDIDVIPAHNNQILLKGRVLREFTHSAVWHSSPGRMARFIIVHKDKQKNMLGIEEEKGKYLGIISLGSDFISVGGRDEVIGGDKEHKMKNGRLKHTCMGSSISPTQPLGYDYLGGKLIALMVCSDIVENFGNSKYRENLVGITTTSLYGGYSQYNRLKYWKKCKSSEGKVKIEPTEDVYETLKEGVKENYPKNYPYNPENGCLSHPKQRLISFLYRHLNINISSSEFKRGVYWCPLYENSNKFLRCGDDKLGVKRFDNSVEKLVDIGKTKYANKRVTNLIKDNRLSNETLFYDDLIGNDGNYVKSRYLSRVGR